jgi:hypothetical protein
MDQGYERMRAQLLVALADHESGWLDHAGLQVAMEDVRGVLGDREHAAVRHALFEADVALEYAQQGHPVDLTKKHAALRRMRRNLREALG